LTSARVYLAAKAVLYEEIQAEQAAIAEQQHEQEWFAEAAMRNMEVLNR
jgi:hypothetical protein